MRQLFTILSLALITLSCNRDGVIEAEGAAPQIVLDSASGVYTLKVGESLTISPQYLYADENTTYSWSIDNQVVCTQHSYTFTATETGEVYILIEVANLFGTNSEEIRIDVSALEIPTVTIVPNSQMTLAVGSYYTFKASVKSVSLPTTIGWSVNGTEVGEGFSYLFEATTTGVYILTATASNSDGTHSDSVEITVLNPDNMPFVWEFESEQLHTIINREILIAPTNISQTDNVTYYWKSDRQPDEPSRESYYAYTPKSTGRHTITATASVLRGDEPIVISHIFTLDVYPEDKYYRAKSADSSNSWSQVFEYTPAPGQFIGEGYTATTAAQACEIADNNMRQNRYVSLGGFGGYIVVGFDHSIDNGEGYDFAVAGNSFNTSSEPGIVWVMQDENGDGIPNDTWYELAGSESGKSETIRNYQVTYYRPSGAGMNVEWVDNQGNSGTIDYLPTFHKQDYYYPEWIAADSYTLKGTRLKERNYDKYGNGAMWIQPPYDWGYADNYSSIDRLSDGEGSETTAMPNGFDISNAIDHNGKSITLSHIDFIKVQTACNTKSGWLGENSTEVFGFYEL